MTSVDDDPSDPSQREGPLFGRGGRSNKRDGERLKMADRRRFAAPPGIPR